MQYMNNVIIFNFNYNSSQTVDKIRMWIRPRRLHVGKKPIQIEKMRKGYSLDLKSGNPEG